MFNFREIVVMPKPTYLNRDRGFAAISILTIVVLVSLFSLTYRLKASVASNGHVRQSHTIETLARAKSALIAFAAENPNRPGGMPCPDRDGDGEAELTCDRPEWRVGFFPWQTLRTGELRDASGTRLWYALSGNFRNDPDIAINSFVRGDLSVQKQGVTGTSLEIEDAIALVIAPGAPLPHQRRAGATDPRIEMWLEGENAGGAIGVFEASQGNSGINDTVVSLVAEELFDVVDRVVASRIRSEIVPLIRDRVFNVWQALPYAVPFEAPLASSFEDSALASPARGLLPASNRAGWVHWDLANLTLEAMPSTGTLLSQTCRASLATEIRCDITYTGSLKIRIAATARNVGRAFVEPLSVASGDFGPATLVGPAVVNSPVDAAGNARIEAAAILPGLSTRIRVTLKAPRAIRELTDENVPVATPHSWFARNRWHEVLYYAAAESVRPGGNRQLCGTPSAAACIAVENRQGVLTEAAAVLVFMGRIRSERADSDPAALSTYLESANAVPTSEKFIDAMPSSAFNDAVIILCSNPTAGCKS
jgi:hypothetical protein